MLSGSLLGRGVKKSLPANTHSCPWSDCWAISYIPTTAWHCFIRAKTYREGSCWPPWRTSLSVKATWPSLEKSVLECSDSRVEKAESQGLMMITTGRRSHASPGRNGIQLCQECTHNYILWVSSTSPRKKWNIVSLCPEGHFYSPKILGEQKQKTNIERWSIPPPKTKQKQQRTSQKA